MPIFSDLSVLDAAIRHGDLLVELALIDLTGIRTVMVSGAVNIANGLFLGADFTHIFHPLILN